MNDRPSSPSPAPDETDPLRPAATDADPRRWEADLAIAQSLACLGQWEWDLTTGRIAWSPEMIELVGCETPPSTFDDVVELLGPEHALAVRNAAEAAIERDTPLDIETPLMFADGRVIHLHSRARVVRAADGTPLRLVGMSQDITAHKTSAAALELSESRYRALLEQIDDVVYSIDREGRFTTISGAFERATGYAAADWVGRPFTDLMDPSSIEEAIHNFAERLAAHGTGRAEYVIRGRDAKLTVEVSNAPYFVDGELVGIVGVARDITTSKMMHEAAERERRLASLGNLAGSAAHEFNNVLMSIMPFAELMRRLHGEDERVKNATEHIMNAVRRGRQISQQILRLSRPANPALGPVDIGAWLGAFELDTRAALPPRYRLTVFNDCSGARVIGDRALIDQVAANLLSNAREAMPSGGEISIRVWRPQLGAVAVSFSDEGHGIHPEHIDHVCDPMFTTRHGSSGLGLTVAHQAMSLQNGMLRVESTPGEGSTFTIVFRESPAEAPSRSAETDGRQPLRILLVEDEEAIAVGIGMLLEGEGMQVRIAARGAEVLPAIAEFTPDVTVLDVNLADANGMDVLREIRARWSDHRVIFSTGHRDAATLAALREAQLPTISKPYEISELVGMIRSVVDRK